MVNLPKVSLPNVRPNNIALGGVTFDPTSWQGGSVKVTCVRKMADAAALYCVFYLY